MIYLLASFIDRTDNDKLVGFRCVNVTEDNIGRHFDLETKHLIDLVESGKLEVFNVKNRFELEDWSKIVTVFDVNTMECLTEIKFVKLSDTEYIDCLGKRYTVRNLAELDNFASEHEFTNLDKTEVKKKKYKTSKNKSDDEIIFKDVCGLSGYERFKELTDKYIDFLEYSDDIEVELLDKPRVGRFEYELSDKKDGKVKVCKDRRTGLYGVCCVYDKYVWVLLDVVYEQLETVQSSATTYVAGLHKDGYWEIIELKRGLHSDRALDWFSTNNKSGKNGKLFVALSGNLKSGYKWYLIGKGLKTERQIGCNMVLTDALFTNIRGYTKHVNSVEFYDPRHGESIIVSLKDYTMESMMNFKKSFTNDDKKDTEEDVVLFYNIICDVTSGEIVFNTDKGYTEGTITYTDIDAEFINNITIFLNATPKCETLDVKIKRHMAKRTQYTYQKIDVELTEKFKKFLGLFVNYTSARVLGSYWTFKDISSLDEAIADMELDKYTQLTICNDGKELYGKLSLLVHKDKSVDLIMFTRRSGRIVRVDYVNLIDEGGNVVNELESGLGIHSLWISDVNTSKIYDFDITSVTELKVESDVPEKPTIDIVQTYKKNKLTLKLTSYKKKTVLEFTGEAAGITELNLYLTTYDGLEFKTFDKQMITLSEEDRKDINSVRKYVKAYNKVMNESQPLLGGYHAGAFKIQVD